MNCIKNKYGYVYYSFESDLIGDYVHIYNLYIYRKYRRQGRAKELLQMAIINIKNSGWKNEIQIVAKPRENSINKENLILFYKKLGLKVYDYYI